MLTDFHQISYSLVSQPFARFFQSSYVCEKFLWIDVADRSENESEKTQALIAESEN